MNDPSFSSLGPNQPASDDAPPTMAPSSAAPPAPQFGLLEVIEAFTAMRHEFRTQTRENRPLVESVTAASESLRAIESTLDQKLDALAADSGSQSLLEIIIDLDIGLQRAVDATSDRMTESENQHTELRNSIRCLFHQSGFMQRWLAKRFFQDVIDAINSSYQPKPDPTAEGIRMLLGRLRRMMAEKGVERVDTTGKPFDARIMQAISSVASETVPAGNVAEEISPAYNYQGRLVRFAEVKVAKAMSPIESSKESENES